MMKKDCRSFLSTLKSGPLAHFEVEQRKSRAPSRLAAVVAGVGAADGQRLLKPQSRRRLTHGQQRGHSIGAGLPHCSCMHCMHHHQWRTLCMHLYPAEKLGGRCQAAWTTFLRQKLRISAPTWADHKPPTDLSHQRLSPSKSQCGQTIEARCSVSHTTARFHGRRCALERLLSVSIGPEELPCEARGVVAFNITKTD